MVLLQSYNQFRNIGRDVFRNIFSVDNKYNSKVILTHVFFGLQGILNSNRLQVFQSVVLLVTLLCSFIYFCYLNCIIVITVMSVSIFHQIFPKLQKLCFKQLLLKKIVPNKDRRNPMSWCHYVYFLYEFFYIYLNHSINQDSRDMKKTQTYKKQL